MKTIKVFLLTVFVSAMIGISMPVLSQNTPTTPAQTERYDDDDNDGNYSWIGLLGLLGLAGLIRRDKDAPATRTTATTGGAKYAP